MQLSEKQMSKSQLQIRPHPTTDGTDFLKITFGQCTTENVWWSVGICCNNLVFKQVLSGPESTQS